MKQTGILWSFTQRSEEEKSAPDGLHESKWKVMLQKVSQKCDNGKIA
jgi:hypothetical protein